MERSSVEAKGFGYRKFTVTLVIALETGILAWYDKLTPTAGALLAGLASGYMALNMLRSKT